MAFSSFTFSDDGSTSCASSDLESRQIGTKEEEDAELSFIVVGSDNRQTINIS